MVFLVPGPQLLQLFDLPLVDGFRFWRDLQAVQFLFELADFIIWLPLLEAKHAVFHRLVLLFPLFFLVLNVLNLLV